MRQDPVTVNGTWWRVLWINYAGEGRFDDLMAPTAAHAAFLLTTHNVELTPVADLVSVTAIDDKDARP